MIVFGVHLSVRELQGAVTGGHFSYLVIALTCMSEYSTWPFHLEFLVNKTNRCTEFQLHWYYHTTCFGQSFFPSARVLSHTSALVHFVQL